MALTLPSAADFKARYPVFTSAPDSVVVAIIDEASAWIGESWEAADQRAGIMLYAAHTLQLEGYSVNSTNGGIAVSGRVTSVAVGDVKTTFEQNKGSGAGGHGAFGDTAYGQRLLDLMRRNVGAIAVV